MLKRILTLLPLFGAAALGAQTNLWPNPGFETWNRELDLPGDVAWQWTYRDLNRNRSSFAVLEQSAKEAASGKYSLHLKDDSADRTVSGFGWRVPKPHVYAGKVLDFSIKVKQIQAGRPNTVGVVVVALTKGKPVHAERFIPTAQPI